MELTLATGLQIRPSPSQSHAAPPLSPFQAKPNIARTRLSLRQRTRCCSFSADFSQTRGGQAQTEERRRRRVFLLDVNPLCYSGSTPSLRSFGFWVSLLLRRVSLADPVIAVFDGENGSEHRRKLLPSYKAHRWKPRSQYSKGFVARSRRTDIEDCLGACRIPSVSVAGQEADDVIATLAEQALGREEGMAVVIASPDKDFKQLLSERVSIVVPLGDLRRWSFCTLGSYVGEHGLGPGSELSLRCLLGDAADGVPGIQTLAPGFGRKTAVKLLERHGTLENLLSAAAVRTVGKPYAQDALVTHAHFLRTNYEVLSLRRDLPGVSLRDDWLARRDCRHDKRVFDHFFQNLEQETKEVTKCA